MFLKLKSQRTILKGSCSYLFAEACKPWDGDELYILTPRVSPLHLLHFSKGFHAEWIPEVKYWKMLVEVKLRCVPRIKNQNQNLKKKKKSKHKKLNTEDACYKSNHIFSWLEGEEAKRWAKGWRRSQARQGNKAAFRESERRERKHPVTDEEGERVRLPVHLWKRQ